MIYQQFPGNNNGWISLCVVYPICLIKAANNCTKLTCQKDGDLMNVWTE